MFIRKMRLMEDEPGAGGGEGPTIEQLQAQVAALTTEKSSMSGKMDELLSEAKKAKNAKREEETARQAAEEASAKASGDHEQLLKSSEAKREKLQGDYDSLINGNNREKINNAALKMAGELAEGYNAEILSESIAKRLKISDGMLKVTDDNGELTVSTLDELKTIFKNNDRYASLLKGNQSSGGGATGGSNSGSAAKVKTRAEFEALSQTSRVEFVKGGGKIND